MRRLVAATAVVLAVGAVVVLPALGLAGDASRARDAALAKAHRERPAVVWQVEAASFYLVPRRVYDRQGQLRESATQPLPGPRWVVELRGHDAADAYQALIDVSPLIDSVGNWQIASEPAGD